MPDIDVGLLRGTLDLLILKSLAAGPLHGYGVTEWIEAATSSELLIAEGTLYPALHRLERQGLLASEWGLSNNNRQAKFYHVTRRGRQTLHAGVTSWHRFVTAAGAALRQPEPRHA